MTDTYVNGYHQRIGEKYDPQLRCHDIVTAVRQDIAAAKRGGQLPEGLRCTVRKRDLTWNYAIDIVVRSLPPGSPTFDSNPAAREANADLHRKLLDILAAYRSTEDDAHTGGDYRSANFYADVRWEVVKP